MKKTRMSIAGIACILLTACGTIGTGTGTGNDNGNGGIFGSIFGSPNSGESIGNILISVIGLDKPSQADLIGAWRYKQPGVAFTSENLLAKAGGEVAASSVKEKLNTYYNSLGISQANTYLQFTQEGQFSGKIDGKSISGTYTYDQAECKLTLKTMFFTVPAYTKRTTTGMSILFEAKKLLTILQTLAALSGNTNLQTIGDISQNYDGIRIGLDMIK